MCCVVLYGGVWCCVVVWVGCWRSNKCLLFVQTAINTIVPIVREWNAAKSVLNAISLFVLLVFSKMTIVATSVGLRCVASASTKEH